jgi:hypothetical protein
MMVKIESTSSFDVWEQEHPGAKKIEKVSSSNKRSYIYQTNETAGERLVKGIACFAVSLLTLGILPFFNKDLQDGWRQALYGKRMHIVKLLPSVLAQDAVVTTVPRERIPACISNCLARSLSFLEAKVDGVVYTVYFDETNQQDIIRGPKNREPLTDDVIDQILASCKKDVDDALIAVDLLKKDALAVMGKVKETDQNSIQKTAEFKRYVKHFSSQKIKKILNIKGQQRAKNIFKIVMRDILDCSVSYVTSRGLEKDKPDLLDSSIFGLVQGNNIAAQIPKLAASQDGWMHVFSAASQLNCAEATSAKAIPAGQAMTQSNGDNTQGPLAQRSNPVAFELVNAFLNNLGYNMVDETLPIAGTSLKHGYLMPTKDNLSHLTQEFEKNRGTFCIPCYESTLGKKSHYISLGAAPALAYAGLTGKKTYPLQTVAALENYGCQFNAALELLRSSSGAQVHLHITPIGCGVFGNKLEIVGPAFQRMASAFQDQLTEQEKQRVKVTIEVYKKDAAQVCTTYWLGQEASPA